IKLDGFHIGKYPVTQAQWKAVMGETLEDPRDNADQEDPFEDFSVTIFLEALQKFQCGKGDNYPMYDVSWEEAQEFCRRLSEVAGRRYMLPTEAQWEYAARGGKKSRHYKYAGSNDLDDVAWYLDNSEHETHPVGMKKSNELGIDDMSGNVWEWCSDWYGKYDGNDTDNPQGAISGAFRVFRGDGSDEEAESCRVSFRCSEDPASRFNNLGFCVVCIL
ncbi:MAG: formylglycine-generating enzyme family protein, partial [Bacteroidales bacterium]|nr:formylglycine-generating enzyme family protein [Bacteroidales bacterium]